MAYIPGTSGNDTLMGTSGIDTLEGFDGDDILKGSAGADVMNGGDGIDTADYSTGPNFFPLIVDLRTGTVTSNQAPDDQLISIENVVGYGAGDRLTGDAGPNRLDGWSGDDFLDGGDGPDVLIGNQNFDWALYNASSAAVTVNLKDGTGHGGSAEGDKLIGIEAVEGSAFDDILIGDDVTFGYANTLRGGAGNDYIEGGRGNDTLDGGDGDDWLVPRRGEADILIGGVGIDTADYSAGTSAVLAQEINSTGVENFIGTDFNDSFAGGPEANSIHGGRGDDALRGGWGADVLDGGDGNDRAFYGYAADGFAAVWVHLGTGQGFWNDAEGDTLTNIENLAGFRGNDLLYGSDADNIITGDWGDDNIGGGAGNDSLYGQSGSDWIDGGAGADYIDGGTESAPLPGSTAPPPAIDTVDFTFQFGAVSVSLKWGAGYWNAAEGDRYVGIENVRGTAFNDFIEGDDNANVLIGGGGDDVFTFRAGFGKDTISDFVGNGAADGDRLQFTDGLFSSYQDLLAHSSQVGGNVLIQLDAANHLTLLNTQLSSLHAGDFLL